MSGRPLDYESPRSTSHDGSSAGYWALILALAAIGLDAIALSVVSLSYGMDWLSAFSCMIGNGAAAPSLAVASICLACVDLAKLRGRSWRSWLALPIALVAGAAGVLFFKWSADATMSV